MNPNIFLRARSLTLLLVMVAFTAGCTPCQDLCPSEDETSCAEGQLKTCVADEKGCLDWNEPTACEDGFCEDATSCGNCRNECAAVGTDCNADGQTLETCTADADGCRKLTTELCPHGCSGGACTCVNECTPENMTECTAGSFRTCTADAYDCLSWSELAACPGSYCIDGSACGGGPYAVLAGGYVVSGAWHGNAALLTSGPGTTIAPTDFSALADGGPLCASGSVAATPDYSGFASIRFKVNQSRAAGSPAMTLLPSGTGVSYSITNTGGSPLRLSIEDATGLPSGRWCANVTGSSGTVAWEQFNTTCWTSGGTAYSDEALEQIAVYVSGNNLAPVIFDFCINSIGTY